MERLRFTDKPVSQWQLQEGLESLEISNGWLAEDKPLVLPSTLKKLIWFYNYNPHAPFPVLPEGLEVLNCVGNELMSLPALPPRLKYLACYGNKLESLPELPETLETLVCDKNRLKCLPKLPQGLLRLDCDRNFLTELPSLPNSITSLHCRQNMLTSLPPLPRQLKQIYCCKNHITELPPLPPWIEEIYFGGNFISMLPRIPESLEYIDWDGNPLPPDMMAGSIEDIRNRWNEWHERIETRHLLFDFRETQRQFTRKARLDERLYEIPHYERTIKQ
jgi:Leucine-rich repeat (LRR) protein